MWRMRHGILPFTNMVTKIFWESCLPLLKDLLLCSYCLTSNSELGNYKDYMDKYLKRHTTDLNSTTKLGLSWEAHAVALNSALKISLDDINTLQSSSNCQQLNTLLYQIHAEHTSKFNKWSRLVYSQTNYQISS